MNSRYGSLFQIEDFSAANTARRLERVTLTVGKTGGGYDEAWLQRLMASHPQALPIAEIEAYLAGAVPVCLELDTNAGPVDLLLVSSRGDIVIVECKLWRNPQARREVIGQIIDYAKEMPRLSYEAFDAAIRKAEPVGGATKSDSLYKRAGAEADGLDEASFIDAVSRNLRRGRFLLLIVGDGIQEGVEHIAEFLQQHAGMHFTLALVEVAIFRCHPAGYLVQPRVLMKTQMVPRGIVSIDDDDRVAVRSGPLTTPDKPAPTRDLAARPAPSVPATISEARLYEAFEAKIPGGASRLRQFVGVLEEELKAVPRLTPTLIVLQGTVGERTMTLASVDTATGTLWFEHVAAQAASLGRREAGLRYYEALASLVADEKLRAKKASPHTITGTATLPAGDLLSRQADWLAAIRTYFAEIGDAVGAAG